MIRFAKAKAAPKRPKNQKNTTLDKLKAYLTAAEPEEGSTGPEAALQITYQNLLTVEERLARAAGLGFRVRFDAPGTMVFEVCRGVDHSILQQERPVVIFSDEFGNLADPKYTKSTVNFKNRAYVAGEGEGTDRIVEIIDAPTGEEVREVYVDARQPGHTATIAVSSDEQFPRNLTIYISLWSLVNPGTINIHYAPCLCMLHVS